MNKICMYTICRNESKFVDSWWRSASEADKVAVIIHDSDDDTEKKLQSYGALIKKTHYDTWRFDVGKNDALDWAREIAPDCNILVYTALDEVFDPGWADIVRANWEEDTIQCYYNFVQTHDGNNQDLHQTKFNWIHSNDPNWYWKYPIHEALLYKGELKDIKTIDLFDKVKLNHWPDNTKKRGYSELLEARYQEYPDQISLLYLMILYTNNEDFDKGLELFSHYDSHENTLEINEWAYLFNLVGVCYLGKKDYKLAKDYFAKVIEVCPEYRDPYVNLASTYMEMDCYYEAISILWEAIRNTVRHYDWVENPTFWDNLELIYLANCSMHLKNFSEAFGWLELYRLYHSLPTEELQQTYEKCRERTIERIEYERK